MPVLANKKNNNNTKLMQNADNFIKKLKEDVRTLLKKKTTVSEWMDHFDLNEKCVTAPYFFTVMAQLSGSVQQFDAALKILSGLPAAVKRGMLLQKAAQYQYSNKGAMLGVVVLCIKKYTPLLLPLVRFIDQVFSFSDGRLRDKNRDDFRALFFCRTVYYERTQSLVFFDIGQAALAGQWKIINAVMPFFKDWAHLWAPLFLSVGPALFTHKMYTSILAIAALELCLDCLAKEKLTVSDVQSLLYLPENKVNPDRAVPFLHNVIGKCDAVHVTYHLSRLQGALERLLQAQNGKQIYRELFEQKERQGNNIFVYGLLFQSQAVVPYLRQWAKQYLRLSGRGQLPLFTVLGDRSKSYIGSSLLHISQASCHADDFFLNLKAFLSETRDREFVFNQYLSNGQSVFSDIARGIMHRGESKAPFFTWVDPAAPCARNIADFLLHYRGLYKDQSVLNRRLQSDLCPVPLLQLMILSVYALPKREATAAIEHALKWVSQLKPQTQKALWGRCLLQWRVLALAALVPAVFPLFLKAALRQYGHSGEKLKTALGLDKMISDRPILVSLLLRSAKTSLYQQEVGQSLTALTRYLPDTYFRALWEQKLDFSPFKTTYQWVETNLHIGPKSRQKHVMTVLDMSVCEPCIFGHAVHYLLLAQSAYWIKNPHSDWTLSQALNSMRAHIVTCLSKNPFLVCEDRIGLFSLDDYIQALLSIAKLNLHKVRQILISSKSYPVRRAFYDEGQLHLFYDTVSLNGLLVAAMSGPDMFTALFLKMKAWYIDQPQPRFNPSRWAFALQRRSNPSHRAFALQCRYHVHTTSGSFLTLHKMRMHLQPVYRNITRLLKGFVYRCYHWENKKRFFALLRANRSRLARPILQLLVPFMRSESLSFLCVHSVLSLLADLDVNAVMALLVQKNFEGINFICCVVWEAPQYFMVVLQSVVSGILFEKSPLSIKNNLGRRCIMWRALLDLDSQYNHLSMMHRLVSTPFPSDYFVDMMRDLCHILPFSIKRLFFSQCKLYAGQWRTPAQYARVLSQQAVSQGNRLWAAELSKRACLLAQVAQRLNINNQPPVFAGDEKLSFNKPSPH